MFFIYKMPACRKIIAKKVADKGNQQQRGCSLSRKWSHTRSRCKIDAVYFQKGTAPKCGAEVEAKSAAIAFQASSGQCRHRRPKSGSEKSRGSGILFRCNYLIRQCADCHTERTKWIADCDMLCSLICWRVGVSKTTKRRHSPFTIGSNHELAINLQWQIDYVHHELQVMKATNINGAAVV